MKPDIALNLSLANIDVTVCLIRYPSFSQNEFLIIPLIYFSMPFLAVMNRFIMKA